MDKKNEQYRALTYTSEPSLLENLYFFWQKKLIIIFAVGLSVLGGFIYIHYKKPTYELEAAIYPPTTNNIAELNYQRSQGIDINLNTSSSSQAKLPYLSTDEVYFTFIQNLIANKTIFLKTKDNHHCSSVLNNLFIRDTPQIIPKKYLIRVRTQMPQQAKRCLISYLSFVENQSTEQLLKLIKAQNKTFLMYFQNEMFVMKRAINENTKNKDAKPKLVKINKIIKLALNEGNKKIKSDALIAASPVYNELNLIYLQKNKSTEMNDEAALNKEASHILKNIRQELLKLNLQKIQARYLLYKKITDLNDKLKPIFFSTESSNYITTALIWPKNNFILLLSICLGLLLGLFTAVMQKFIGTRTE